MLQVFVSILYFINKVFLVFNERLGWGIGALASGAAIFYFFGLELYIFCALEVACFFIMIYGALGWKDSKKMAKYIYGICTIVTIYLLFKIPESGLLEFITSFLFMLAFISLAEKKQRTGWSLLGISHLIMTFITFQKEQYFFATLQCASVLICIVGFLLPELSFKKLFSGKNAI